MDKRLQETQSKILNIITEVFIAIMIMIFPFVVDKNGFFKILEVKWYTHLTIVIAYFSVVLSVLVYFGIYKRQNYFKNIKLSKAQIAIIVYMIVATISCLASPFFSKYDLFIGVGRGEGLINTLLYAATFLAISIFGKFSKRQICYISISSVIFNAICILQYFGFNPFNMYQNGIGTHNVSFIGTVGNLDSVSMILCLYITVAFMCYVFFKNTKKESALHILSVVFGLFIFQIIDVDSGKVGMLFALMLIFPYILLKSEYLRKTLHLIAGMVVGFLVDLVVNLKYYYSTAELKLEFQFNWIALALMVCAVAILALSYILKKIQYDLAKNKKFVWLIYGAMLIIIIAAMLVIYFYDFGISILHDIHEMLHGNITDEMGTYRGFLWKRTVKLIKDAPFIGTGPDTFAIRFMSVYKQDVANLGKLTINDTAANVYLTMSINMGIIGLISYIAFSFFIIGRTIKILLMGDFENVIQSKEKYYVVCAMALIALLVQDFFNLWVVIVTPLLFVLFGITYVAQGYCESHKEKY